MGSYGQDIMDLGLDDDFLADLSTPAPPIIVLPRTPLTPWPAKLPIDLALNTGPLEELFEKYGVTETDYIKW